LKETLVGLDVSDVDDLARRAARAREIVYAAALPPISTRKSARRWRD